jgi:hypothetical protein
MEEKQFPYGIEQMVLHLWWDGGQASALQLSMCLSLPYGRIVWYTESNWLEKGLSTELGDILLQVTSIVNYVHQTTSRYPALSL